MKENEFLDGVSNIEADIVERFILMDNKLQRKANRPRSKGTWLRYGSVAACFALIAATIIAVPKLREYNPGPDIGDTTTAGNKTEAPETDVPIVIPPTTEAPEAESTPVTNPPEAQAPSTDAPIVIPPTTEAPGSAAPATEAPEADAPAIDAPGVDAPATDILPEYAFTSHISDPRFENYLLSGSTIYDPEQVGELFSDISLTVRYGDESAEIRAEVYEIKGIDSNIGLCVRYIDDGYDSFYRLFLDYDGYQIILAEPYSFASLDELRGALLTDDAITVPNYFNQKTKDGESYSTAKYFMNDMVVGELKQLLLSLDGERETQDGVTASSLIANANEYVYSSCSFNGSLGIIGGSIYVLDSGHLYLSAFGGQLFNIGVESAREIISFVTSNGSTKTYDWIERDGELFPVIHDENAQYPNFVDALYGSKLYGQLYFADEVTYWEQVYGAQYRESPLSRKALDAIAQILSDTVEILSEDQGRAVETGSIPGFSDDEILFNPVEAVVLTHNWDVNGENTCAISVYDSGHVGLNGTYYYIGTNFTDQIFEIIHYEWSTSDS